MAVRQRGTYVGTIGEEASGNPQSDPEEDSKEDPEEDPEGDPEEHLDDEDYVRS